MTNAVQNKIKASFSASSTTYDVAANFQRDVANDLFDYVIQQQLAPNTILELGAGTGYLSHKINLAFPQSQFLITDCAENMLRLSQNKNKSPHVVAFSESLPFITDSYDFIVSSLMLQWCDITKTLAEITRVLNTNGHFIATTLGPNTLYSLNKAWHQLGHHNRVNTFLPMTVIKQYLIDSNLYINTMTSKLYTIYFSDTFQLLKNLKHIGSIKRNHNNTKSLLTKNHINQLAVAQAEYEVILIHAEKRHLLYHGH